VESTFVDGKEEGDRLLYYSCGALHRRERYVGGVLQGEAEWWDTKGRPKADPYPRWK
jgi:antitoxin component YwqK of YwqJK toxin-antitoxin module